MFRVGEGNTLTLALSRERERGLDSRVRGNDGGGYRAFSRSLNSHQSSWDSLEQMEQIGTSSDLSIFFLPVPFCSTLHGPREWAFVAVPGVSARHTTLNGTVWNRWNTLGHLQHVQPYFGCHILISSRSFHPIAVGRAEALAATRLL